MGLEIEKLDVYRVARELDGVCSELLLRVRSRELKDQLERATLSVLLNVAEGAGGRGASDKQRFYAIARGSATECAALLDALASRRIIAPHEHERAHHLAVRAIQMLSRLSPVPKR